MEFAAARALAGIVKTKEPRPTTSSPASSTATSLPPLPRRLLEAAEQTRVARRLCRQRESDPAESPHAWRCPRDADHRIELAGREEARRHRRVAQETNDLIVEAWRELGIAAGMLSPRGRAPAAWAPRCRYRAVRRARDARRRAAGLDVLTELQRDGIRVVNSVDALLNAHDKLRTTRLLVGGGLPHPKHASRQIAAGGERQRAPCRRQAALWHQTSFGARRETTSCERSSRSATGHGSFDTAPSSRCSFLRPGTNPRLVLVCRRVAVVGAMNGWHARVSGVRTSRSAGRGGRCGHRGRLARWG